MARTQDGQGVGDGEGQGDNGIILGGSCRSSPRASLQALPSRPRPTLGCLDLQGMRQARETLLKLKMWRTGMRETRSLPPPPRLEHVPPRSSTIMILNAALLILVAVIAVDVAYPFRQVKCNESKAVFAHLIVGNTYNYDATHWETDIVLASSKAIDVFTLNVGRLAA
ncbi:hypothetical protein FS749_009629 [Ceratobasidium sp. UAMH 11750]|nr:hypothetical protein FS749_009629 [Ceratobasidium sp. UAMH 11750]